MPITDAEREVVDHPFVQRLRVIRATGFSYLPFPGATHSRYAHSLGVMHLAGHAFDRATGPLALAPDVSQRLRSLVRVAALCHDLGHAPFSHSTEFAMPALSTLGLTWYAPAARAERRATHEDYTIAILARTDLAAVIAREFPFTARHVAAVISHDVQVSEDLFIVGGLNFRRLLSQIVSSELDVDRLDYLVRDSYYTGARYGQVDVRWLLTNLGTHVVDDQVSLALNFSGLYAFDDFLIARHHMFLMVYFHHKSVVYEELLRRFVEGDTWSVPADLDAYLTLDDVALEHDLRASQDPWARRITGHDPYRRVLEVHGTPDEVDLSAPEKRLRAAGLDVISAGSTGKLSRYNVFGQKREKAPVIYVRNGDGVSGRAAGLGPITELAQVSQVLQAYADARRIARLYVAPADVAKAKKILA